MALIKCSECGKEISDKARCCPHCGAKVKKTKIVAVIGCIVLAAFLISCIWGIYFVVDNNNKRQLSYQDEVNNTEKSTEEDTEKGIIKEQEDKYERYVNIAIKNTKEQLKHPDSIVLNKVVVEYKIKDEELVEVSVAIDYSSENDIGTSPRGYSVSGASPTAVDDQNYMFTSVSGDDQYYEHYYKAVTEEGYLKDVFSKKADEYYEGVLDGELCGYFNYNIEDIVY